MMIDLTCPAEVFQVTPPAEGQDCAAVSLYNLSDRVIVAAEVTLRLQNGRGVDLEKVTFERQGLNGRPHIVFRMEIPSKKSASATGRNGPGTRGGKRNTRRTTCRSARR